MPIKLFKPFKMPKLVLNIGSIEKVIYSKGNLKTLNINIQREVAFADLSYWTIYIILI